MEIVLSKNKAGLIYNNPKQIFSLYTHCYLYWLIFLLNLIDNTTTPEIIDTTSTTSDITTTSAMIDFTTTASTANDTKDGSDKYRRVARNVDYFGKFNIFGVITDI